MKGFVELPMVMIIGLVAMFSVFIFFMMFKVHINSVYVDAENLNRYQEVPATVISSHMAVADEVKDNDDNYKPKRDLRPKEKINCFTGNGPAGKHGPVASLCIKRLPDLFTKLASGTGGKSITGDSADYKLGNMNFGLSSFLSNLRLSLPQGCSSFALGEKDKGPIEEFLPEKSPDCNLAQPKLKVSVPVPVMVGREPTLYYGTLTIGTSYSSGESFLVTWPKYSVEFVRE